MVLNQQVAHDEKEGVVTHMYTCRVLAKSRTVAVVVFADGTHQLFFLDPDANVPPAVRTSDPIRLVDSAVFEQLQACVLSKLPESERKFHEEQSRVAKEQDVNGSGRISAWFCENCAPRKTTVESETLKDQ